MATFLEAFFNFGAAFLAGAAFARPKNIEGPTAERVAALSTTLKEERVAGTTNAWHLGTAAPSPEQPVRVRYGNNTDLTAGSHADVNGNVHARMSHVTASTTMRKTRIMNVGSEEKESARKAQDSSTPESPGPIRTTTTTIIPDSKKPGLIAIEMRKVVLGARPRRNVDRDSMDRELETGGGPPSPSPRVHARVAFAFHPRPRTPSTTPAGRARRRSRQSPPSVWILESTRRMTVSQPFLARPSLAPPATDGQSASLSRRRTWGKEWGKGRGRRRTEPGDLWDRNR